MASLISFYGSTVELLLHVSHGLVFKTSMFIYMNLYIIIQPWTYLIYLSHICIDSSYTK